MPGCTGGFEGFQPNAGANVLSHAGGLPEWFGTGLAPPAASPVTAGAGPTWAAGTETVYAGLAPGPVEAGTDGATARVTEDFTVSPSRPRRASWRSPGFPR